MVKEQEKFTKELLDDAKKTNNLKFTGVREKLEDSTHGIKTCLHKL